MTAACQRHLGPLVYPDGSAAGSGMEALRRSSIAGQAARDQSTADLLAAVRAHVARTGDQSLKTALAVYDAAHGINQAQESFAPEGSVAHGLKVGDRWGAYWLHADGMMRLYPPNTELRNAHSKT